MRLLRDRSVSDGDVRPTTMIDMSSLPKTQYGFSITHREAKLPHHLGIKFCSLGDGSTFISHVDVFTLDEIVADDFGYAPFDKQP